MAGIWRARDACTRAVSQCPLTDVCTRVRASVCARARGGVFAFTFLVVRARELAVAGCKAVLMEKAVVGDSEDVPYTSFCIEGLTSKASSEFKITGVEGMCAGSALWGNMRRAAGNAMM